MYSVLVVKFAQLGGHGGSVVSCVITIVIVIASLNVIVIVSLIVIVIVIVIAVGPQEDVQQLEDMLEVLCHA